MTDFLARLDDRVLILDGGMGTCLLRYNPTDADWGLAPNGKSLMNLSDALVYTHPEWIEEVHAGFFAVSAANGGVANPRARRPRVAARNLRGRAMGRTPRCWAVGREAKRWRMPFAESTWIIACPIAARCASNR